MATLRRTAAALCLLVLLIACGQGMDWKEFSERVRAFPRRASLPAWQASGEGTWFWFDRAYAPFLESVRKATPEQATVALVLGRSLPDGPYDTTAAYFLAPRRVVGEDRLSEADFVATYASVETSGKRVAATIVNGTLGRRR